MSLATLEEWAAENFRTPPSTNTLRKWAREGSIQPAPVKHGRSYYVEIDARYHEPPKPQPIPRGSSLLNRIEAARNVSKAA
ncbi:excisionase [uncultured Pseudomonas sp.]|uniref:excisionase n=1 Tax=uncultured Pseudomonas sp. TaxID=114707 RepID=UPI00261E52DC|nr:excisionase [uncultured Pseudomonas sp.]